MPFSYPSLAHLLDERAANASQGFYYLKDEAWILRTHQHLRHESRQLAVQLKARFTQGARVVLLFPPGEAYLTALFGCFYAGLVAVPVYPPQPPALAEGLERMEQIAQDAQASGLLTLEIFKDLFSGPQVPAFIRALPQIYAEGVLHEATSQGVIDPEEYPKASDLALLLYTSGSTGQPKGVMLSHGNLLHNAAIMAEDCRIDETDTFCVWVPPYHVSGLFSGLILPLYAGATNYLFSPLHFVQNPLFWLKTIEKFGVSISGSPTFAYELCAQLAPDEFTVDLSSWRVAVVGGEALRLEALQAFQKRFGRAGFSTEAFYTMYGLTESTMIATGSGHQPLRVGHYDRQSLIKGHARREPEAEVPLISSGRALADMQINIVSSAGEVLPEGHIGEIWIAGPSVAMGYWQNTAATEKTFRAKPPQDPQHYLRTGDLGFMADQTLYVTGRLKEVLIIRGLNHYPEDLEATVKQSHPALVQSSCACFQYGDAEAFGLLLEISEETAQNSALVPHIQQALSQKHGVRADRIAWVSPGQMPRTSTRKIRRGQCALGFAQQQYTALALPQPSALQDHTLSQIIATYSTHPAFNENTPLEELGLDSMGRLGLLTQLKQVYQVTIPTAWVLEKNISLKEIQQRLMYPASAREEIAWEQELHLPAEMKFKSMTAPPTHVLLTGATGFLGRYLVKELLEKTSAHLTCVVRGKNATVAKSRLLSHLSSILDNVPEERITVVCGVLEQPYLGLDKDIWNALTETVDCVCHNGAQVNFVLPYDRLREVNVGSTLSLLQFSGCGTAKRFHFVSSLAVFNSPERHEHSALTESLNLSQPNALLGGYAQSKFISEAHLQQARARGLNGVTYRTGFVTADPALRVVPTDDFLVRFICGCVALGCLPRLSVSLPLTPVNEVAHAVVQGILHAEETGVWHVLGSTHLSLPILHEWLVEAGYRLECVPLDQWMDRLKQVTADNPLFPLLPFLTEPAKDTGLCFLELFENSGPPYTRTAMAHKGRATDAELLTRSALMKEINHWLGQDTAHA